MVCSFGGMSAWWHSTSDSVCRWNFDHHRNPFDDFTETNLAPIVKCGDQPIFGDTGFCAPTFVGIDACHGWGLAFFLDKFSCVW